MHTVTGRLQGLDGNVFDLQGEVQGDGGMLGIARMQGRALFFSGQREGAMLEMLFAEPDADMKPNLATVRRILFERRGAAAAPAHADGAQH